jgi:nucleoid DNA-binding protein
MAFTKSQIIDAIAEKTSVDKKVAEAMLDCLAQLAYEHAKDSDPCQTSPEISGS